MWAHGWAQKGCRVCVTLNSNELQHIRISEFNNYVVDDCVAFSHVMHQLDGERNPLRLKLFGQGFEHRHTLPRLYP